MERLKSGGYCDICGENKSYADHSECSKIRRASFGDSCERKKPARKRSKKHADNLGKYLGDKYS